MGDRGWWRWCGGSRCGRGGGSRSGGRCGFEQGCQGWARAVGVVFDAFTCYFAGLFDTDLSEAFRFLLLHPFGFRPLRRGL